METLNDAVTFARIAGDITASILSRSGTSLAKGDVENAVEIACTAATMIMHRIPSDMFDDGSGINPNQESLPGINYPPQNTPDGSKAGQPVGEIPSAAAEMLARRADQITGTTAASGTAVPTVTTVTTAPPAAQAVAAAQQAPKPAKNTGEPKPTAKGDTSP